MAVDDSNRSDPVSSGDPKSPTHDPQKQETAAEFGSLENQERISVADEKQSKVKEPPLKDQPDDNETTNQSKDQSKDQSMGQVGDVKVEPSETRDESDLDSTFFDDDEDWSSKIVESPVRHQRAVIVSSIVLIVGIYLLVGLYADFRYWLRDDTDVVDLGSAEELFDASGAFICDCDNQLVQFDGTPDVRTAARLTTTEGYIGYLRLIEGGADLFASIPREISDAPDHFPNRFVGRMLPLGRGKAGEWVRDFFNAEDLRSSISIPTTEFEKALEQAELGNGTDSITSLDDRWTLRANDQVQLVVSQPGIARVQMGKSTWSTLDEAFSRLKATGRLVAHSGEDHSQYYNFVIQAEPSEYKTLQEEINGGSDQNPDLSRRDQPADPAKGAWISALSRSVISKYSDIFKAGKNAIGVKINDHQRPTLWKIDQNRLVAESGSTESIEIPFSQLQTVSVSRPIQVGPATRVVHVGELPSSRRMDGILFLIVLGIVASNMLSITRRFLRGRVFQQRQ